MKKIYYFLFLSFTALQSQNFETFSSGVANEKLFSKSISQQNNRIICSSGSPFFEEPQGVYFLNYNGSEIVQDQYFTSPDTNDAFGHSVAIDNDYAAVGAPSYHGTSSYAGAVHLYRMINGSWQYITRQVSPNAGFNRQYGFLVKIHDNQLFAFEPEAIESQTNIRGKIHVYDIAGDDLTLVQTIPIYYGFMKMFSVNDGKLMYSYKENNILKFAVCHKTGNQWTNTNSFTVGPVDDLTRLNIKGDNVFFGVLTGNISFAKAYHFNGTEWEESASIATTVGDFVVTSVDGNSNTLLVGLGRASVPSSGKSPCLVYKKNADDWQLQQTIYSNAANDNTDSFGAEISIESGLTLISAKYETTANGTGKLYFTTDDFLSVKSHEFNLVTMYPNPTTSKLFIDTLESVSVKVYNTVGQVVLVTNNFSGTLDVSNLPSGIYTVSLLSQNRPRLNQKFIKK